MRRLLWIVAWVGVAVWSLFAWGAYGLFDFFGGVAVRNADVVSTHPETVEWLSWGLTMLKGLGLAAITIVWATVSLLILAVPAILGLFLGRSRAEIRSEDWNLQHRHHHADRRDGEVLPPQAPMRRIERR
ncbi:hypothetical protein ACFOYU_09060 [Microvirga sp. GCM10011540]|uniref:hypothetical protein n=1 Tax=Microvirga sp. GCM10011540 TaxID=3317338 RepID=UPI0036220A17